MINLHSTYKYTSDLFDEKVFYRAFMNDVGQARSVIIIESPFIGLHRANYLMPSLRLAVERGVLVIVNTRDPDEHDDSMRIRSEAVIQKFQSLGIKVYYTSKLHRKVSIIDRSILWEGSLNILSQNNSCELMRRTKSRKQCKAMLRFLSIKHSIMNRNYEYL